MTVAVEVTKITTEDAKPTTAPFKVSKKTGKRELSFELACNSTTGKIRAIRVRLKPLNRNSGKLLYSRGMVCGSGDRCGSPVARSLVRTPVFKTGTIALDESIVEGEADGEYEIKAWAMDGAAWSS